MSAFPAFFVPYLCFGSRQRAASWGYTDLLYLQEEEANLVLGGDEGKECTYAKGYVTRQAVFACVTCTPQGEAGFCLACSINCHDGHEVSS